VLILDLVLIGLAITLEPIPLTAFLLVLASANGAKKGAAFIVGWAASLAVVVVVTVLLTGNNPPRNNTAPSVAALVVKVVIGAVLLVIALRRWRRLGKPKPPKKTPKWQTGIDNMSTWFAMALGPLTQPWGLVAVGVAVIVEAKLSSWLDYLVLFLFCLIATATYLVLELYAIFRPAETQAFLAKLRNWIDTHTDQVIIVVSCALGFWLVVDSIYLIVT
jgi:threonine/homoserine/homoserine lactone efflux protein